MIRVHSKSSLGSGRADCGQGCGFESGEEQSLGIAFRRLVGAVWPPWRVKRIFVCKGCGAKLIFAPSLQSLKCEYCGTIAQLTADNDHILQVDQASLIVPMRVEEEKLELAVFELMAKGEYTPDDMIEASRFVKVERFYAPFYRFTGSI